MRLNVSTDYAMRVLLYLAAVEQEWTAAAEIADAYDISSHHVAKVAKDLTARGWVVARRGSGGGLRIHPRTRDLRVGRIVEALETIEPAECFRPDQNGCRLAGSCRLQRALREACRAFIAALDGYSVDDLTSDRRLPALLGIA